MKPLILTPGKIVSTELPRQMEDLVAELREIFKKLPSIFTPALVPTLASASLHRAKAGQLIFADAISADKVIMLPTVVPGNATLIGVVPGNMAVNAVRVTTPDGLVNNVASYVLPTADKLYLFMSDGVSDWWGT
jgi:hypothetical protein